MYIPKAFEVTDQKALENLIEKYPLATLVNLTNKQGGISADAQHIPLYWHSDETGQQYLHGHIARVNPLWEQSLSDVLCIFQGPQAYITPNWYPTKKQHGKAVPTWNYVAAHIRGRINFINDKAWILTMLEELTRKMEADIEIGQKEQWKLSDAPKDYIEKMVQGIIGIEVTIESIEGIRKLSQNQPMVNYEGIINGLQQSQQSSAAAMIDAMNTQKSQCGR